MLKTALTFVVLLPFGLVVAEFSKDFQNWLDETYGLKFRSDLGARGSFGGKSERNETISNQPVVLVHGLSSTAGDNMLEMAKYLNKLGYKWSELYATTYGNGDQGNPLQWSQYTMQCFYVKQIRALIVAVRLYTGQPVDVIAYSLGVPISRKAILGGKCVDTQENLGGALTQHIDTFVGVAGPNHGISLQSGTINFSACSLGLLPICNPHTGLYSGLCPLESTFLKNINSYGKYEGKNIFSIYSRNDQLIGYSVCNRITAQIPGQNGEKIYDNKTHSLVFSDSYEVQRQMILNHLVI
uniref:Lipase n=1 Tax=Syphacia muris TaxID=451379 RepID=A0A0N5A886_9BILA